jgi:hypothetical protein
MKNARFIPLILTVPLGLIKLAHAKRAVVPRAATI